MTDHERALVLRIGELQRRHAGTERPYNSAATGAARTLMGARVHNWHREAEHGPRVAALHRDGYETPAGSGSAAPWPGWRRRAWSSYGDGAGTRPTAS
jgi:hypothetical protein